VHGIRPMRMVCPIGSPWSKRARRTVSPIMQVRAAMRRSASVKGLPRESDHARTRR